MDYRERLICNPIQNNQIRVPLDSGIMNTIQYYIPLAIHSNHTFPVDASKYGEYIKLLDKDNSLKTVTGSQKLAYGYDMEV